MRNVDKEKTKIYLMWATKIVAAMFQTPATLHYFLMVFDKRPHLEKLVVSWFAVFLVDVLLIASLWILEDTETDPRKRASWAFMAIFLTVAVVAFGFYDEGWLAWGPRVGIIGLTINAVSTWLIDWRITYNTREAQEQRLRDQMVIERRKVETDAHKDALKDLKPFVVELMKRRETDRLNMHDIVNEPMVINQPVVEKTHQLEAVNTEVTKEGVVYLGNGKYGWQLDADSEVVTETALGKPYTSEHGANLARLAALRKMKNDSTRKNVW